LLFANIACDTANKKETNNSLDPSLQLEKIYKAHLKNSFSFLDSINYTNSTEEKKSFFKKARKYFKLAEPILSYSDKENYKSLNSPNLLRIQEEDATDIKIRQPLGFQVLEENLFSEELDSKLVQLKVNQTSGRLKLIYNNSKLRLKRHHILWILKDAIVRIATTGLSNFDSPVLGQSLQESSFAYASLSEILKASKNNFQDEKLYSSWLQEIENATKALETDFDEFDRYDFLQKHTHLQLSLWNQTVEDWSVVFPFEMALSTHFNSLFSKEMFNINYFSDHTSDTLYLSKKIRLGKQLFHDKNLSANKNMSCATCHIKEKGFTDGKKVFNKNQIRNTPTIAYAGLQKSFFHDSRAGSLEGQIIGVVTNHNEFDSNLNLLVASVSNNENYKTTFDSLYAKKITDENIRHAIASYVRTLNKFNSKFDNNINFKEATLSEEEKKGFNLFMGKAACATCHFPPLFNGTVPPNFNESELELIGIPKTNNFKNPIIDTDLGRYNVFQTEEKKHFFKTPTLRNIAKTAPYMHNGVYNTLEDVLEFYNQGGGNGLGMKLAHQTLPSEPLNLTEIEKSAIISFLKTLNDN
jgi:cytochrome c peroxidase